MALIEQIDGWSPRYHHIKELDRSWKIGEDEVTESVMDTLDTLEAMIDDLKAYRDANRPKPIAVIGQHLTPRGDGF